jgi:hypothetical protein
MHAGAAALALLLAACRAAAQPAAIYAEPDVEMRGDIDLDGDGTPELYAEPGFIGSACMGCPMSAANTVLRPGAGVAVRSTAARHSPRLIYLAPGTRVGSPDAWSDRPHRLMGASLHYDDEGTLTVDQEDPALEGVYLGVRLGGPHGTRYGWVRLTARWEARAMWPGAVFPYQAVTLHAYALGAPGEAVRVGERP